MVDLFEKLVWHAASAKAEFPLNVLVNCTATGGREAYVSSMIGTNGSLIDGQLRRCILKFVSFALAIWTAYFTVGTAAASKQEWLELARLGWGYELRDTMVGRDMSIPVRIHGRAHAGASVCVIGEAPLPQTR